MAEIDFEEVLTLTSVIVECGKHGPAFTKIAGAAQARLKEIEESFGQPLPAKVEAKAAEKAEAKQAEKADEPETEPRGRFPAEPLTRRL